MPADDKAPSAPCKAAGISVLGAENGTCWSREPREALVGTGKRRLPLGKHLSVCGSPWRSGVQVAWQACGSFGRLHKRPLGHSLFYSIRPYIPFPDLICNFLKKNNVTFGVSPPTLHLSV